MARRPSARLLTGIITGLCLTLLFDRATDGPGLSVIVGAPLQPAETYYP